MGTPSVCRIRDGGASALPVQTPSLCLVAAPRCPPSPCSLGAGSNFKVKSFCKFLTSFFPPHSPSGLQGRVDREPDGKGRGEERCLVPV